MAAAATAALVMVLAALAGNGDRERASMAMERRDAIEESVVRLLEGVSWVERREKVKLLTAC